MRFAASRVAVAYPVAAAMSRLLAVAGTRHCLTRRSLVDAPRSEIGPGAPAARGQFRFLAAPGWPRI